MEKVNITIGGYEMIQTKAAYKSSRSSKITIPYDWAGKNVIVILMEE